MIHIIALIQTLVQVWNWHVQQVRQTRNSILTAIGIPLVLIISASFAGAWDFRTKLWVTDVAIIIATFCFFYILARRAIIGTEISAVLKGRGVSVGRIQLIVTAVETFLQFAAAVVVSEMVIGFIALFVPAHDDPAFALLGYLAGFGLVMYGVWQAGNGWWKRIVITMLLATLATSLVFVYARTALAFVSPEDGYGAIGMDRWVYLLVGLVTVVSLILYFFRKRGGGGVRTSVSRSAIAGSFFGSSGLFIGALMALVVGYLLAMSFIGGRAPWGTTVGAWHVILAIAFTFFIAFGIEKAGNMAGVKNTEVWGGYFGVLLLAVILIPTGYMVAAQEMSPATQLRIFGTVLRWW